MAKQPEARAFVDPLQDFVGYQLRRASAAVMTELAADLAAENISVVSAAVLLIIDANPRETQARIGRELSIKRANIAPMIAKLEEGGLIERDTIDGRSFGLATTARGKLLAARLMEILLAREARLFGPTDSVEYTQLRRQLEGIRARIGNDRRD